MASGVLSLAPPLLTLIASGWQVAVELTQRGTDMSGNSQVDLLSVEMGTSGISRLDWLSMDGREWQLAWSYSARIGNRQVQKMMRLPSKKFGRLAKMVEGGATSCKIRYIW